MSYRERQGTSHGQFERTFFDGGATKFYQNRDYSLDRSHRETPNTRFEEDSNSVVVYPEYIFSRRNSFERGKWSNARYDSTSFGRRTNGNQQFNWNDEKQNRDSQFIMGSGISNQNITFQSYSESLNHNSQFYSEADESYEDKQFDQKPDSPNLKYPIHEKHERVNEKISVYSPPQTKLKGSESDQVSDTPISFLKSSIDCRKYLAGVFGPKYLSVLNLDDSDQVDCTEDVDCSQVFPEPAVVEQYKNTPPSPEELGKILKGFVIYMGHNQRSELEKDPIVVIQESFSRSRFGPLDIEESTKIIHSDPSEPTQLCILRWRGIMLTWAVSFQAVNARFDAAISLINALAHSCYTIQEKCSYYCGGKLPKFMLKEKERNGIFKIVTRKEIVEAVTVVRNLLKAHGGGGLNTDVNPEDISVVIHFIDEFFKQKTFCELMFGTSKNDQYSVDDRQQIFLHAVNSQTLEGRAIKGYGRGHYTAVSRRYSPQQICCFILRYGQDHIRYRLMPPQGPDVNLLLPDMMYSPNIIKNVFQNPNEQIPISKPQANSSKKSFNKRKINWRKLREKKKMRGGGNQPNW